jgi:hypothetical protein
MPASFSVSSFDWYKRYQQYPLRFLFKLRKQSDMLKIVSDEEIEENGK